MTKKIINNKILQELQIDLNESDINMANRLGVKPKLYKELVNGEKPLSKSYQNIISIILQQIDQEAKCKRIRHLLDELGITRHKLAAQLNLKPNRVRKSIETDNDELLRKVLSLTLEEPELGLIEKLSKQ